MATSYNGWYASPDLSVIGGVRTVPGTSIRLSVHYGTAGDLLIYVAEQFHKRVESLEGGASDDGGWNYRGVGGAAVSPTATNLSNHASATAIDLNWNKHPRGARNTFSAAQVSVIRQILAECHGAIYWGGDYKYPSIVDEMHFEINTSQSGCDQAWAQLQHDKDDDMPFGLAIDLHGLEVGETKAVTIAPVNTGNLGFGSAWMSMGCDRGDAKVLVAVQLDGESFYRPWVGSWESSGGIVLLKGNAPRSACGAALPNGTGKIIFKLVEVTGDTPTEFTCSAFIEYGKK